MKREKPPELIYNECSHKIHKPEGSKIKDSTIGPIFGQPTNSQAIKWTHKCDESLFRVKK